MRIHRAVRQLDVDRNVRIFVGRCGDPAFILDDVSLARLERDIDRILTDDRCQRAGGWADQIADGEVRKSDSSVDR